MFVITVAVSAGVAAAAESVCQRKGDPSASTDGDAPGTMLAGGVRGAVKGGAIGGRRELRRDGCDCGHAARAHRWLGRLRQLRRGLRPR